MRLVFVFFLLPVPTHAWTFTPGVVCQLSHETAEAEIALTYDPAIPLYSVTVRRDAALPQAPVFSMQFLGPEGRIIVTDRHSFSEDGRSVTAKDSGFGNVLDGLQFNTTAEAILGDTTIAFPLEGAAGPVADFRRCAQLPVA